MKKTLTIAAVFATAIGVYAQGTLNFANNVSGQLVTRIYAPQVGAETTQVIGAAPGDLPTSGSTVYTGAKLAGTGYSAQLWAAPGAGQTTGFVQTVNPAAGNAPVTLNFRTGSGAGVLINTLTVAVPGAPADSTATCQLRVWDNGAGTLGWADAVTKGTSLNFNVANLGGGATLPPNLLGLTSFSLANSVPEPSTIALGVIGAAALLFRRRK